MRRIGSVIGSVSSWRWSRHLLEPGGGFALPGERHDRLFPAELFIDLFASGRGWPSIPGHVIASVIVLPALYGHADRAAVEAPTSDLR